MNHLHLFLPMFRIAGRRYRLRCRLHGRGFRFRRITDRYPEGVVHSVWVGPILLVVMVDGGD